MMKTFKAILIFLILSVAGQLNAQVINFVQFGVEHGLAQSQVQSLVQDSEGKLWVGTISGLSVWDGSQFTNYDRNDSLAEDWVTASFRDSKGNLWFGHWGGSITRYDKGTEVFESIEIERFNSYQEVRQFVEDTARNVIIFATEGSGLFYYDVTAEQVKRIQFSIIEESKFIRTIYLDSKGNLWIGTENEGIFVFPGADLLNDSIQSIHIKQEHGLSSNNIDQITEFNDKIWVATNAGITLMEFEAIEDLRPGGGKTDFSYITNESGLNSNSVTCLEKDTKGRIWIGTSNKGVIKCTRDENGKLDFTHYDIEQGLSFYSINCLYYDRENTLWIGTDVGLNQYTSEHFVLYDESVGLNNNIVWSVAADAEKNIWLGTNKGVTQLLNADDINNDSLSTRQYKISGLSDVPIYAIYPDREGNIWFGTADGSLFKRNKIGRYERVNIEAHIQDMIYSIAEDNDGNIWMGTRTGIVRINKRTNRLNIFTQEKDSIGGNNVFKVLKDKKGTLWFAVLGGTLTSWDGEKFKVWGPEDGMKNQFVLSAAEDSKGNLWFGCYTGGLYKYDGKTFTNYNETHGLHSSTPYAIIPDKDDNIWIGTSYGVEKFDPVNISFTHYTKTEGFLGVEINPNSIARDNNDNLWFGTILGVVKYNPNLEEINPTKPTVALEGLRINQESAPFPVDNEFSPLQNNLTFDYLGVSLKSPDKLRYRFRLLGQKESDIEWSEPTEQRAAYFSGLDAGKYQFQIKAINSDKIESDIITYPFNIKIPFYMSIQFYVLQFVVILIMLALAVFYGRKTGGSRTATILASIAVIIVFEYGINYVEDNVEATVGPIVFIKVMLNVILGLILFPVENFIRNFVVADGKGSKSKQAEEA